jgi:arginine decarboxylase-like protein
VGYGDISLVKEDEYLLAFFIQMVGICFFAYIMGNIHSILENYKSLDIFKREQNDDMEMWMLRLGKS